MKNNGKTDRERWRDEFERTGENPVAWQLVARAHLAAANVLLQSLRLAGGSEGPAAKGHELDFRLMPIHLLLGYALENLVKGLLVARGETATWNGSFEAERSSSLDKGLRHHCLPELFRVASLKTSARETRLLEDLRDAIESEKYPVGVRPRFRKRTLGVDPSADVKGAVELFERMERSLRHICLDGVLSPCNPSTLGVDGRPMARFDCERPAR